MRRAKSLGWAATTNCDGAFRLQIRNSKFEIRRNPAFFFNFGFKPSGCSSRACLSKSVLFDRFVSRPFFRVWPFCFAPVFFVCADESGLVRCHVAAWPGVLPPFLIALPRAFATAQRQQQQQQQHPGATSEEEGAGGGGGGNSALAEARGLTGGESGDDFASAVQWRFERCAPGRKNALFCADIFTHTPKKGMCAKTGSGQTH